MKKLTVIIFLLTLSASLAFGQKIGGAFIGTDLFLSDHDFRNGSSIFTMDDAGIAFGFFIPVNVPHVDTFYKVRVVLRNGADEISNEERDYISAANEFLIGKRIPIQKSRWDIMPHVGLGLMLENIYEEWGVGTVYDLLFLDVACTANYHFQNISLGVMVNFEQGVYSSYDDYSAKQRVGISLVLWK